MNSSTVESSNSTLTPVVEVSSFDIQPLLELIIIVLIIIIFGMILWGYIYTCTNPNTAPIRCNRVFVKLRDLGACYKSFPSNNDVESNLLPIHTCACASSDERALHHQYCPENSDRIEYLDMAETPL